MQFYMEFLERAHAVDCSRVRARNKKTRVENYAFDMSDCEFIKTYRLSKELVQDLIQEISPYMSDSLRSDGMDIETKVLVTLAFYAVGSYQNLVGQSQAHSLSQASVSRALHEVTAALNNPAVLNRHIAFPLSREHRECIKRDFYTSHNIPGVLGCIDGTHVTIVRPIHNEEQFYNHKGHHSLNVLIICDSNLQILCVDSSHPGATHDSTVWNNNPMKPYLEELQRTSGDDFFLVGDSGYPLRRIMMTPILNAVRGSPEAHYNDIQVSTRNVVERCIEVLKTRFRCLLVAQTLHYNPKTVAQIVNACCVLHNIAQGASIELPGLPEDDQKALDEEMAERALDARLEEEKRARQERSERNQRRRHSINEDLERNRAYQRTLVQCLWRNRRK